MRKKVKRMTALLLSGCLMISGLAGCGGTKKEDEKGSGQNAEAADETQKKGRILTDMRGEEVEVPEDPQRVAILDKGFLVQSMKALGVEDKICAT